ncbi:hypothetical protein AX774_g7089, partial [Zancudomyces culisetae]
MNNALEFFAIILHVWSIPPPFTPTYLSALTAHSTISLCVNFVSLTSENVIAEQQTSADELDNPDPVGRFPPNKQFIPLTA